MHFGLMQLLNIELTHFEALAALAAGILILITPRFLNIILAVYLIVIGAVGLGVLN